MRIKEEEDRSASDGPPPKPATSSFLPPLDQLEREVSGEVGRGEPGE